MAAPAIVSTQSEYNQQAFVGGMNLLSDDTRLQPNQYRIGFNLRNRYDKLDLIPSSVEDTLAPTGLKQELVTFGDYLILFVNGKAYYKYYTDTSWVMVDGFQMSPVAPRYWTAAVPVSTTNYLRLSTATTSYATLGNAKAPVSANNISGAAGGNLPGLLVQDNINQPMFIFLDENDIPTARVTQTFAQWSITFTDPNNTVVQDVIVNGKLVTYGDQREYVPIGNCMAWVNGILYIASQDGNFIYRSVNGRPLDFVVNVPCNLVVNPPYKMADGVAGISIGDATTTSYSVGVGGISCLRGMSSGALFVAAGNANFSVSLNTTQNAPTEFGEYTFIRTPLFNANCLSDRAIFDSVGDTRFIDLTGVRSFNAVSQNTNEGRNLAFTASIKGAFTVTDSNGITVSSIIQDASYAAGILFDDFELYACQSIFGPVIAVYDTINSCWVGFDLVQTGGARVKKLAKIELDVQALYAITEDDRLYRLYCGPTVDKAMVRTIGLCANIIWAGSNVKYANPKYELQPRVMRVIINGITRDCSITLTPYINNRQSSAGSKTKTITYDAPAKPTQAPLSLSDVDTMLQNEYFSMPDSEHGWKVFATIEWDGGSITQFSAEFADLTPLNPLRSR